VREREEVACLLVVFDEELGIGGEISPWEQLLIWVEIVNFFILKMQDSLEASSRLKIIEHFLDNECFFPFLF